MALSSLHRKTIETKRKNKKEMMQTQNRVLKRLNLEKRVMRSYKDLNLMIVSKVAIFFKSGEI